MQKPKAFMNWSGGKDSALALQRVLRDDILDVRYLLTTVNSKWQRVTMHGLRRELLQQQAAVIGIELIEVMMPDPLTMQQYEHEFDLALERLLAEGITHSIFGDIFLADVREYREKQLLKKGLTGVFPLWNIPTKDLMNEFFSSGMGAVTICTDASKLDKRFCGRELDADFIHDLPDGVDICGENGEFHTFVHTASFFSQNIRFSTGDTILRDLPGLDDKASSQFYYCDILPEPDGYANS
ncbi:MAG: adenine nucleotide alpha hydrolase [Acidobacteria bacterium]|nr:adenine nucleotide alpha hydrolase [Acidobacteriota bacterium]